MDSKQARSIIRKTREDYNTIASHFAATRAHIWPEFKLFKSFIRDGQNILDWGCGNGRLALCIKDRKVKYFGVDQSVGLLKIARKNFAGEIRAGAVKFFSNAARPKKFPDNFFDVEFAIASFFHLPDEKSRLAQLRRFYRELKKGGKLVMLVWNLGSDWAKQKAKKDWKILGDNDFIIPWKSPDGKVLCERYYHHFKPEELKIILDRSGFRTVKLNFMENGTWSDSKGGRNLIVVATK